MSGNPSPTSWFDPALTRRILGLSYPVMLAMLTQTLINQVDHVLVGHLPVEESTPGQAAVQLGIILLWAFGGLLSAISVGTQALTARRIGAEDVEGAGAIATNSQVLAVLASLVVTTLCWFAAPWLFSLVNKDAKVVELGVPFLRWRFLQITGMVTTLSLKSFFDGLGKTRVHLGAAVVMNIANFLLCVGLMFGSQRPGIPFIDEVHAVLVSLAGGHLPHLGVPGAGLASMISSYIGLCIMVAWSFRPMYRPYRIRRLSNLSARTIWDITRLSVPSGLATMFAMSGFLFVLFVVHKLDNMAGRQVGRAIYSAATSNIISVMQLIFILGLAYATGTATLVSQSMGAKKPDLAESYANTSARIGMAMFSVFGLLIALYAEPILRFWNPDPEVVRAAAPILRLVGGIVTPVISAALVYTQALYGAGNTIFVMVAEGALHLICLVPLSYLAGVTFGLGLLGVWSAMIFYVCALALIMYFKFRSGDWKHIHI